MNKHPILTILFLLCAFALCAYTFTYTGAEIQALFDAVNNRINTTTGAGDAGKLIKTDASGLIDDSFLADGIDAGEIADDAIQEEHLKAVDASADEDILTKEDTTGDFEWHSIDEMLAKATATGADAITVTAGFGSSLNADDLELNGTILQTAAEIPHTDVAETWTNHQKINDDKCWKFGSDSDLQICWNSVDAVLEFRNSADTPIFKFDPANYTTWASPTATPAVILNDSDNPGTDKFSAKLSANYVDGADGSENNDVYLIANVGGTETILFHYDQSDNEFDFKANNINTTGVIKGRASYGADITGAVAHDTTATHGVFYHFTAAATVTLDAAADAGYGAQVCYRVRDAAEAAVIDLAVGEKINLAGTALAAGVAITATGVGESVCMVATTDADGSGTDGWEAWGPTSGWASE